MTDSFQIVTEKLQTWGESLVAMLPNIAVALVVVLIFWLFARLSRRLVSKVLGRFLDHVSLINLAAAVAAVLVLLIGLFIALQVLQLDRAVTSLLAGAGVVGLALGFALQNIAANFMAGTMIAIRRPFRVGDLIETNDHFGTVDAIDLRATILHSPQGQVVIIPNKEVFETALVNYSQTGRRRVDLSVGVSYGDDLEKAKKVALEAVDGIEGRDPDRPAELFYEEFGGSSINFVLRFWISFSRQGEFMAARSEAIERVKVAFDRHDISIPFPIRTLDFGIRGGERLAEHLASRS